MKKNLLITLEYPPQRGGIARYLQGLVAYFPNQIQVVCGQDELLYHFFWPRWIRAVLFLWHERHTYEQVLVSHLLPLGTAACVAKILTRKPYIIFVHGMDVAMALAHPWKRLLSGIIFQQAKMVVTNSRALKEELEQHFRIKHTMVIYPSVSATQQHKNPTAGEHSGPIELLTVARLVPRKGHIRVLEALAWLKQHHPNISLHYTIIGNGPELSKLQQIIRQDSLENLVDIMTDASDVQRNASYHQTDIFVMPTTRTFEDREGFGMVYLEAASFGVPSIATQQSGVDEAIRDGETGILIPMDASCALLSESILRLATDAPLRQRLGEQARTYVETEFAPKRQWEKLRPSLS